MINFFFTSGTLSLHWIFVNRTSLLMRMIGFKQQKMKLHLESIFMIFNWLKRMLNCPQAADVLSVF